MRLGILGLSIINPIVLINTYETMKEKMKTDILMGNKVKDEKVAKMRKAKQQFIAFFKVELFLELFNQVPIQILLLLLTKTSTETVTLPGLNAVFEKSEFNLGKISLSPAYLLLLSIVWSLFSCMSLQLKSVVVQKEFFPTKSKIFLMLYAIFATLRRILTFVIFFVPSLGLFNLLHHWQWEQFPFKVRKEFPELTKPTDKLEIGRAHV